MDPPVTTIPWVVVGSSGWVDGSESPVASSCPAHALPLRWWTRWWRSRWRQAMRRWGAFILAESMLTGNDCCWWRLVVLRLGFIPVLLHRSARYFTHFHSQRFVFDYIQQWLLENSHLKLLLVLGFAGLQPLWRPPVPPRLPSRPSFPVDLQPVCFYWVY